MATEDPGHATPPAALELQRPDVQEIERAAAPMCPKPTIIQTPITWNSERETLTRAYRSAHQAPAPNSAPTTVQIAPKVVVLHWTAGSSFSGAFNTFDAVRLVGRPKLAGAGALNVSAHFLVDRDGSIHQLLPVTTMARHVIGLNHVAVGVENVGGAKGFPLTEAQVLANADLVCWLSSQHPIELLIGHHEYRELEGTPYFDEVDPSYRTVKVDPGDAFMARVQAELERAGVGDLRPPDSPGP